MLSQRANIVTIYVVAVETNFFCSKAINQLGNDEDVFKTVLSPVIIVSLVYFQFGLQLASVVDRLVLTARDSDNIW